MTTIAEKVEEMRLALWGYLTEHNMGHWRGQCVCALCKKTRELLDDDGEPEAA